MKGRPILFSAPMVRAILDGSKTQTRRAVKPQPPADTFRIDTYHHPDGSHHFWSWKEAFGGCELHAGWKPTPCPYGKPGDRLWVREAWKPQISHSCALDACDCENVWVDYPADGEGRLFAGEIPEEWTFPANHKKGNSVPSIHMPRWASRITLEIIGVRVERLNDISQSDARAEGAPPSHPSIDRVSRDFGYPDFPRSWFGQLWEQINGPGCWAANPWVWVIEFRRLP